MHGLERVRRLKNLEIWIGDVRSLHDEITNIAFHTVDAGEEKMGEVSKRRLYVNICHHRVTYFRIRALHYEG